METFEMIAKTLFGLEEVLAGELKALGATDIEIINRAVKYRGDQELLYKSNLHLRTALKVLKPIATFTAHDEKKLYKNIQALNWDSFFSTKQTFAIDSTTSSDIFTHSKFVALKSKDAIVDLFRDKYGERPSVDTEDPDLRINIHIFDQQCTVSLDSTGISLDRRGYRLARTAAPINEVLAAGIILMTGWDKQADFIDPMCGSGTFSIEAALLAGNIPPGSFRSFAFEKWKDFDCKLWTKIKKASKETPIDCQIKASDISQRAVDIAYENAKRAGVEDYIKFRRQNFLRSEATDEKGLIIMNPPYGERLEKEEIIGFYKEIGNRLKQFYNGYEAWIISANPEALKFIGLKPAKKIKLYNGPLEAKLHKYELYKGSKKKKKQEND